MGPLRSKTCVAGKPFSQKLYDRGGRSETWMRGAVRRSCLVVAAARACCSHCEFRHVQSRDVGDQLRHFRCSDTAGQGCQRDATENLGTLTSQEAPVVRVRQEDETLSYLPES